jgi:predicted RecA/RadA family phage recombinase
MENFDQPGEVLHLTAPTGSPGGVVSGAPVLIGSLLVIPAQTADGGEPFEGVAEGGFLGAKPQTEVWDEGQIVYWDDTAKVFTESSGGTPANPIVGAALGAARAAVELASSATGSPAGLSIAANVITLVDYTNVEDATITVTIPRNGGVADRVHVLTEGVDFDAATDNATTAAAIAAAIGALLGVTAVAGQDENTPANEIVTVTIDDPVKGNVRLDGVVR